jgi:membrane-associated phospholipid phosphatase
VLLSFARVYVGTHYPGDVVGGALVGIAVATVLWLSPIGKWTERFALACSRFWESLLGSLARTASR